MLATAIGAAEGRAVHGELFSLYGPVTTWLQVPAIWLLGPELSSIRLQGAVALSLVAGVMTVLVHRLTGNWAASCLAPALWVLSCPDWTDPAHFMTMLPSWPSVYYALLALLSLLLLMVALEGHARRGSVSAALSGALLGVAVFTRLHVGAAQVVATAVVLAFVGVSRWVDPTARFRVRSVGLAWAAGGLVAGVLILGVLAGTKSLSGFWEQAVVGPSETFPSLADPLGLVVRLGVIPAVGCALIVILVSSSQGAPTRTTRVVLAIDVLLLVVLAVTAGLSPWPLLLAIAASGVLAAGSLHRLLGALSAIPGDPLRLVRWAVIGAAGAASWVQLVPLGDALHLWWAAPIPVIAATVLAHRLAHGGRRRVLALAVVGCMSVFSVEYVQKAVRPSVPLTVGALAGMQVEQSDAAGWGELTDFLADEDLSRAHVHSQDGFFAVWKGTYTPATGEYVDWAFGPQADTGVRPALLVCGRDADDLVEWGRRQGIDLEQSTGTLQLSAQIVACGWSEGGAYEFVRQPPWWTSGYWARISP